MIGPNLSAAERPRSPRLAVVVVALISSCWTGRESLGQSPERDVPLSRMTRRPVAVCFDREGKRLFVANRKSGSLSVIDPSSSRVIAEHDVGRGLADLFSLPDGQHWLAVDQEDDALLLLEERDRAIEVVERRGVSSDPVSLTVARGASMGVVASRWSRQLTFFSLRDSHQAGTPRLAEISTLSLPFSPRTMLAVRDDSTLLVADAFGGRIGIVDLDGRRLSRVVTINGHNIRGMALSPDGREVVVSHQVLNSPARTIPEDVQWGILLNNDLRVLNLDRLLASAPGADPLAESRIVNLGQVSRGAGDPSALLYNRDGILVLALSGADQVAMGSGPAQLQRRVSVGRRPSALAASPDGRTICVADTLDDTISIVDVRTGLRESQISLGPVSAPTLAERGERLFFDARLSRGGWMSCHSCHTDGHSNGLNVDTFGDREFGSPKRVPSLLGTGTTSPWGWSGGFATLEEQVHQSSLTTMQGVWPTEAEVAELSAYLRSLTPPRVSSNAHQGKAPSIEQGRELFARECARCHVPPEFTSAGRFDVGLTDESGNRLFNPPSLRGVGLRQPLLHDGRARTLEEVFRRYKHPNDQDWSAGELDDLLAFLRTL